MKRRWVAYLAVLGICLGGLLFFLFGAQSNASGVAPMSLQHDGHYTTSVWVNGEGPFSFIIDTGAQRSVLSRDLADRLGLSMLTGANVKATSGSGTGGISFLKSYSSPLFRRMGEMMVILPPGGIVKDGVMGMELFTSRRLELNFADASVRTGESGPTPTGFVGLPASIVQNTFVVVDAVINGIHAKSMIDTGARRTIANASLRKALGFADGDPRLTAAEPVGGATSDKTKALKAKLSSLVLGSYRFEHPTITFAEIPVLQSLDLDDQPAIVVGVDVLKTLKAMAIDYPRAELQLAP